MNRGARSSSTSPSSYSMRQAPSLRTVTTLPGYQTRPAPPNRASTRSPFRKDAEGVGVRADMPQRLAHSRVRAPVRLRAPVKSTRATRTQTQHRDVIDMRRHLVLIIIKIYTVLPDSRPDDEHVWFEKQCEHGVTAPPCRNTGIDYIVYSYRNIVFYTGTGIRHVFAIEIPVYQNEHTCRPALTADHTSNPQTPVSWARNFPFASAIATLDAIKIAQSTNSFPRASTLTFPAEAHGCL